MPKKDKRTISFDLKTIDIIERSFKKLGFQDLSHAVNYACERAYRNPIDIVRAKAKEAQQNLMYYSDLLRTLEEIEVTKNVEIERKPRPRVPNDEEYKEEKRAISKDYAPY